MTEITTAEKLNKLHWSITTNALTNFFLQLTFLGPVFILFLDALGLSKATIGFLLSLLPFTGAIALLAAPLVARFGYKRTFIAFNVVRVTTASCLVFIPWMVSSLGAQSTLVAITIIVTVFSLARSLVITAYYPWAQEYIPESIQGKYAALNNLFTTLAGFIAATIAGFVLDYFMGLTGFIILIVLGLAVGASSIWTSLSVPGGAPVRAEPGTSNAFKKTLTAFQDRNLLRFLAGLGLLTMAVVPLLTFTPLYLQEQVGLSSGNVVLIQTGFMLGALVSTYLWGWTADRYGSRPVVLSSVVVYAVVPILWMLMPRDPQVSLYVALIVSFVNGAVDMGWIIGSTRLLYVSLVPPDRRSEYTALYFACLGITGGASQLAGGWVVQLSAGVSGEFLVFTFGPYSILFGLCVGLTLLSLLFLRIVRADTQVSVQEFAGLFLRGNPLRAMTALIGYHFARDEHSVVDITERLGTSRSPFTIDELLDLLTDPRFNVRFEAIISIARTRSTPRLTAALIEVFNGTELALSNMAAWALGRVGDDSAIPVLRAGLDSRYQSIRANSARALARLQDTAIIPELVTRLQQETDKGLQMAYGSALGNLQAIEATQPLLNLLYMTQNEGARWEITLALVRLVGKERPFIRLLRESRADLGTATSQAVSAFKRKVKKHDLYAAQLIPDLDEGASHFSRNQMATGIQQVITVIGHLPPDVYPASQRLMLQECAQRLAEFGETRQEYLLLALYTMDAGWHPKSEK